jgi:hypothetical protein
MTDLSWNFLTSSTLLNLLQSDRHNELIQISVSPGPLSLKPTIKMPHVEDLPEMQDACVPGGIPYEKSKWLERISNDIEFINTEIEAIEALETASNTEW